MTVLMMVVVRRESEKLSEVRFTVNATQMREPVSTPQAMHLCKVLIPEQELQRRQTET